MLLFRSLESTLTELGGGVDPFQSDLLSSLSGSVGVQGLSQSDDSLSGTWDGALDHDVVVVDGTVVDEATHWGDGLLCSVEVGGGVALVVGLAHTVDLVVDGGSRVETVLTGSGDTPHDVGWMPGTDTGDLSETSVGLSWQFLGTPSVGDTFETVTLGDGNDVDHLVLLKHRVDRDGLLEVLTRPVNLVRDGTTVQLDLGQMCLLLRQWGLSDLGVH